jgi:hypothetical protein
MGNSVICIRLSCYKWECLYYPKSQDNLKNCLFFLGYYKSLLLKQYDIETLSEFLNVEFTEEEQRYLEEQQKRKIKKGVNGILLSKIKTLDEHFAEVESKGDGD